MGEDVLILIITFTTYGQETKSRLLVEPLDTTGKMTITHEGDAEEADIALGMAKEVVDRYNVRFANAKEDRVSLPPFEVIRILRMRAFLLEESAVRAAMLRTAVGLADGQLPELPEPPPMQGPAPGPGQ